jgi:RNA polymerase sigma-70 factor (ECF subfamily)
MTSRPAQPMAAANPGRLPTAAPASPASASPSLTSSDALRFPPALAMAVERCWRKAAAPADWNLTREQFQAALERSAARRFAGAAPDPRKIDAYLESLHAADLALAVACSLGDPAAWDFFMAQFRPELYRAARAIVGHAAARDADARDLADSLYADLYCLPADREASSRESDGRRKSLFEYFHGRSKLATWLHAVLAQRHVDEIRRARKTESLEDDAGELRDDVHNALHEKSAASRITNPALDPGRPANLAILQAALAAAIGSLDPRDRLRLAYYYADDRTLAEIGRLLGEHEATVSRKLDRTRRDVRAHVETSLRDGKKWSGEQVRACLECASGEWPFDLTAHLQAASPPAADRKPATTASNAAARKF